LHFHYYHILILLEKELTTNKAKQKKLLDWMDEMDFKEYMIYLSIANTQSYSVGRGDIVIYAKDRVS
jgi:hypothetical protein